MCVHHGDCGYICWGECCPTSCADHLYVPDVMELFFCPQESWLRVRRAGKDSVSVTGSRDGRRKQGDWRGEREAENCFTHLQKPPSPSLHPLAPSISLYLSPAVSPSIHIHLSCSASHHRPLAFSVRSSGGRFHRAHVWQFTPRRFASQPIHPGVKP